MADTLFYDILEKGAILFIICTAVVAICFHMIFKADYRPGGFNTMPFLWFQLIKSVHNHSKKKIAVPATYLINGIRGMCQIFDSQKLLSCTFCGKCYVFLFKGETAEVVLSSHKLIEKSKDYEVLKDMLQDGLFHSQGQKWHSRRKMLTPTFHFKILQDFLPSVQEQSNIVVSKLFDLMNEPWVDMMDITKACSWNIFLKTAVGMEIDTESEESKTCHDAMLKYKEYMATRLATPWLVPNLLYRLSPLAKKARRCVDTVHSYMRKIIAGKKRVHFSKQIHTANGVRVNGYSNLNGDTAKNDEIFSSKKKRKAFMDLLLELHLQDETFTEMDMIEECLSFFLGAAVATVNSMAFVFYNIGLYKDVQKKIHDELDEIFKDSDRDITEEDLKAMKYTECVIKESNRLYPIPFISRIASESFKIGDYTVPLGSVVVIFLELIHKDPESFPNPEKFDPTRFFPENSTGRNPYSFIPFSAGPRNCIGQKFAQMKIKTVIATILRKFNISSLDERDKIQVNSDTHTEDQLRMRFSPRDSLM